METRLAPRYTKLRGETYWFQLRVPGALQAAYGKGYIQESLKTRDSRKAAALALEKAGWWKQEFEQDLDASAEKPRDIYLDTQRQIEWIKRRHKDKEDRELALDALWERVLSREVSNLGYGDHSEVPDDAWPPNARAALDAIKAALSGGEDEPPPEYREPFSELATRFVADRQRDPTHKLTEQTRTQIEAVYRLFCHHINDAPLATITRSQVAKFFDSVKKLHRDWGRGADVKLKSLANLLAESATKAGPRLSPRTINRYVWSLRQLWEWAETREEVQGRNPFDGFKEKVVRRKDAHFPWSQEAIQAYFDLITHPGERGNPNPLYWLPRIALLTGMRLNEICSLEVSDIKSAEGVTYFDIPKGKTESSVRVIPVHSDLESIMAFLPSRGYLFPHVRPGGPDKKRSWNIGKRLNRRFRAIDGGSDFHAFRKNVAEVFERARVPDTESAQILGHAKPGMTYGVYSPNGLRIDQKKELIELLGTPKEQRE